ncbi:MAG: flagellar motor protein MotD [Halieaceae bacterium]
MARRKQHVEEENHERWLVSYADFITLLFAFFVVMYSISSVNEGKYRVLSDSLNSAFSAGPSALNPIMIGNLSSSGTGMVAAHTRPPPGVPAPISIKPMIFPITPEETDPTQDEWALDKAQEEVEHLGGEMTKMMSSYIEDDLVSIKQNRLWLEIEIKSKLLFRSASALPELTARPILRQLANYLVLLPNRVQVEGYTDNQAISTILYPSNWELSSARAAAVVRLLAEYGVPPERLVSVGYGQFRPIADNAEPEGRAKNRRVVIILMADIKGNQNRDVKTFQALKQRLPDGAAG